jgi:hypothetical protein
LAASSGPVFYGDAPDDHHPWAIHDRNRPQPKIVTPGTFSSQQQAGKPPADAIVLFDGTDLSNWLNGKNAPAEWLIKDGSMEAKPGSGDIHTKARFGDLQLHVEWTAPTEVKGESQGRGNSGIFLPGGLEIQVLDCYDNQTYPDGTAGGYYGVNPPLVNPLRPPGEYQVVDIVFRRPVFQSGKAVDAGYVTVFINGVLVQDHTPLEGPGGHMGRSRPGPFPERDSLRLQDHGNPVRFRNIWCRELPPRAVEGGTDGYLTTEATTAKRREIAAEIRADAAKLQNPDQPLPELLRLMESLIYEKDAAALQKVEQMATQYVASLKALPADQMAAKKGEARNLRDAFNYLARWKAIPADFTPKAALEQLFKEQNWDKPNR